jgi:hypothetical protein
MRIALLLLALAGCNYGPAPMKCDDCATLCKPFPVETCEPIQVYESGSIAYVVCKCGKVRP